MVTTVANGIAPDRSFDVSAAPVTLVGVMVPCAAPSAITDVLALRPPRVMGSLR